MRFYESEEIQRLNNVWARQESLRTKASIEETKIYGGVKYERKYNGPFASKLVSHGTIISINGEDYVEYRFEKHNDSRVFESLFENFSTFGVPTIELSQRAFR
ncbi:hypothetical protein ACJ41O_014456 [Fusarium nematophilum]